MATEFYLFAVPLLITFVFILVRPDRSFSESVFNFLNTPHLLFWATLIFIIMTYTSLLTD